MVADTIRQYERGSFGGPFCIWNIMRFYTLAPAYTDFLRGIDPRVPNHAGLNYVQKRPYIGVILTVNGHDFLAPMSSPKEWHEKLRSSDKRYFKVWHSLNSQQSLGVICLCNMVPVAPDVYTMIDFTTCDRKYVDLLQAQYNFIKPNREKITDRAGKLFDAVAIKKQAFLIDKCCNFQNLLNAYQGYQPPPVPGQ